MKALDEKLKILEGNHRKLLPSSIEVKIPKWYYIVENAYFFHFNEFEYMDHFS